MSRSIDDSEYRMRARHTLYVAWFAVFHEQIRFLKRLFYPFQAFFRPVLSPRRFKIEHDSFPLSDEEGTAYVVDGFG
jgi:hypothetical protein